MGYGYDAVGNLTTYTDGRNHTTTYTPDALNRRIKTTDVYNDVTETIYSDTPGLVALSLVLELPTIIDPTNIGKTVRSIDANGHTTLSVYDLQGHLTDTYDGIGHRTSHQTYYNDDRIKTSTDTFGQTTTYTYQDNLRQTTIVDPLGVTTTKKYDKVGNLTDKIDSQSRTTHYDYDELNRQKTITDAVGGITSYTYYNDGKTKTIKDAATNSDNTTTYTYDEAGRLTKEHTALGDRIYGYDEVNNRISTKDRNLHTTNYTYDNLNRIKTETWDGTSKQFTYTYDENSNRLSADDGAIKYNYAYDNTDLLTQVKRVDETNPTNPTISFKYGYDAVGNLIQTDELTGTTITASTIYKYNDPRNLNTEITQTGTGLVSKQVKFGYDATGQTAKIERYANGQIAVTTTNAYNDGYGRLTGIEQKNSAGVVIANSLYGFDNLNRLTSETIDGVNRLISYDKTDQVKTVTGSNSEAYTYDLNGNRTNTGYATGANNQLNSDGTYNYQYDGEGNRTKRTNIATGVVDEYVWDYRNRLTAVTTKDGTGVVTQTVGYEYDVDDQRVSKTVNGVVEKYIIDRNQIAYVTDGSGTQTFHYLYGTNVDSVMAQDSPTGMVWSLSDRLGSVNLLADAGGVVVNRRTFDSFGRVLSETNPSVKFRYGYTGREQDQETGLDYYRARYYDAANGRFISVDPAGFGAGDTNLYRYVGNSSTMYTDPSGEILPILALAAAFATGVELAAEAAVLFGLGAAAINVVRQDIAIAQGSSDGFKLDQFAQSAATGAAFGAATPFLSAGLLTGLGALGSGLSLLSAKNEYDNHRYGTAAFDALTAIPFGFVGKLATEKLPRISGLNGKPDPITSKELSLLNNNESLIVPNVVYGKPKGIVDIYDPIYDPQNILLSVRGQINPSLSTVSDVIKLNGIRSEAAGVAKLNNLLPGKELRSLRRGIDRNIAVADISINGSTSSIKGVSGVEDFPGFAKFIPSENRILKTMMINGRNRSQDPEAKILENILNNTRESDAIVINLATERRLCDSCLGVMRDFLLLRPNATINVTGSVIP